MKAKFQYWIFLYCLRTLCLYLIGLFILAPHFLSKVYLFNMSIRKSFEEYSYKLAYKKKSNLLYPQFYPEPYQDYHSVVQIISDVKKA